MSFFPIPASGRRGDYAIFSDESSISQADYMVIGGVFCRIEAANKIAAEIKRLRMRHPHPEDSIQWKNIRKHKTKLYAELIDLALSHVDDKNLDFGCAVFQRSNIDHDQYSKGDSEAGFSKFLYQMNLSFARRYAHQSSIQIYHGQRDSEHPLTNLTNALNAECLNLFGSSPANPSCHFKPAKYADVARCELLQIADLFIGAVAHLRNRRFEKLGKTPKHEIAKYLESECPIASLAEQTLTRHFWIWDFRLRGRA
jgi:hypothetical protein